MVKQLPLEEAFLLSVWMEGLLYGALVALFLASLYINITMRKHQDFHSKMMFAAGIAMFLTATLHLSINVYRMLEGYVRHVADPGAAAWFGALAPWHHVMKDAVLGFQEILGDGVAIYRTWIVWNRNWKIAAPLCVLLIVCMASGYYGVALYTSKNIGDSIFDPRLLTWISTFYALAFVQSVLTTGLMAARIWLTDRRSIKYRLDKRGLMPVLRIIVESAALQLVAECIVLGLYASGNNAQYILLEMCTPLIAITFNAITIRIALRSSEALAASHSSQRATEHNAPTVHTIGSIPLRQIAINISKDVEAHGDTGHDSRSENDMNFDRK